MGTLVSKIYKRLNFQRKLLKNIYLNQFASNQFKKNSETSVIKFGLNCNKSKLVNLSKIWKNSITHNSLPLNCKYKTFNSGEKMNNNSMNHVAIYRYITSGQFSGHLRQNLHPLKKKKKKCLLLDMPF